MIPTLRRRMLAGLAGALLTLTAVAHDGHAHPEDLRLWTSADGRFSSLAGFVTERRGETLLCDHDGRLRWIATDRLAASDRQWIRDRMAQVRQINGVAVAPDPRERRSLPADGSSTNPLPVSAEPEVASALTRAERRVPEETPAVWPALLGAALLAGTALAGGRTRRSWTPVFGAALVAGVAGLSVVGRAEIRPEPPAIQAHFEPFADKLKLHADHDWLYVESNGVPDHRMMVGITAWHQQVPLPQSYRGNNAWKIPLHPKFADNPVSAKEQLFRGAIALAVNGVPIFNPIKNDGRTDTFLAGELDEFGGHCGRGDDYHYHIAPIHLEKVVGKGKPIAYALDGFPIHGYTDASGREPCDLDRFNGRTEAGGYRYYSTRKYPYINGGMRGEVTVRDDQIEPQPRANPVRPALPPLRGAKITGFTRDDTKKRYSVEYERDGRKGSVTYTINANGTYDFVFDDPRDGRTTETYRARRDDGAGDRPARKKNENARKDDRPQEKRKREPGKAGEMERGRPAGKDASKKNASKKDAAKREGDEPRLPWLGAHFDELDTDEDGELTLDELRKEVEKTVAGFDRDKDGKLTRAEYERGGGVRSALAGFVKGHADEVADDDGVITRDGLLEFMTAMFKKADRGGTGKLTKAEASRSGRARSGGRDRGSSPEPKRPPPTDGTERPRDP